MSQVKDQLSRVACDAVKVGKFDDSILDTLSELQQNGGDDAVLHVLERIAHDMLACLPPVDLIIEARTGTAKSLPAVGTAQVLIVCRYLHAFLSMCERVTLFEWHEYVVVFVASMGIELNRVLSELCKMLIIRAPSFLPLLLDVGFFGSLGSQDRVMAILVSVDEEVAMRLFSIMPRYLAQPSKRLRALILLAHIVKKKSPYLYRFTETPTWDILIHSLSNDMSVPIIGCGLLVLVMLLPQIIGTIGPQLPVLFEILIRTLRWQKICIQYYTTRQERRVVNLPSNLQTLLSHPSTPNVNSVATVNGVEGVSSSIAMGAPNENKDVNEKESSPFCDYEHVWHVVDDLSASAPTCSKVDPSFLNGSMAVQLQAHVLVYFAHLYGMFPHNLMRLLHQRYHPHNGLKEEFNALIRPLLRRVQCHPLLVLSSPELELDPQRWRHHEPHDIVTKYTSGLEFHSGREAFFDGDVFTSNKTVEENPMDGGNHVNSGKAGNNDNSRSAWKRRSSSSSVASAGILYESSLDLNRFGFPEDLLAYCKDDSIDSNVIASVYPPGRPMAKHTISEGVANTEDLASISGVGGSVPHSDTSLDRLVSSISSSSFIAPSASPEASTSAHVQLSPTLSAPRRSLFPFFGGSNKSHHPSSPQKMTQSASALSTSVNVGHAVPSLMPSSSRSIAIANATATAMSDSNMLSRPLVAILDLQLALAAQLDVNRVISGRRQRRRSESFPMSRDPDDPSTSLGNIASVFGSLTGGWALPVTAEQWKNVSFLQCQILTLRNELLFEKYLREQHTQRIRRLHCDVILSSKSDVEMQTLHLKLKEKHVECQQLYAFLEQKVAEHTLSQDKHGKWERDLQDKLRRIKEENRTLIANLASCQSYITKLETSLSTTKTELEREQSEAVVLRCQTIELQERTCGYEDMLQQIERLKLEVASNDEIRRRQELITEDRSRLEMLCVQYRLEAESSRSELLNARDVEKRLASRSAEMSQRIKELENQLHQERMKVLEHRHIIDAVQAQSSSSTNELEEKYRAALAANTALESRVLALFSRSEQSCPRAGNQASSCGLGIDGEGICQEYGVCSYNRHRRSSRQEGALDESGIGNSSRRRRSSRQELTDESGVSSSDRRHRRSSRQENRSLKTTPQKHLASARISSPASNDAVKEIDGEFKDACSTSDIRKLELVKTTETVNE